MNERGRPMDQVQKALQEARRRDFTYADGEILGSMCTAPDPAALEAFALFAETNLGDPAHFPGTRALEAEYLEMLLTLANAPEGARGLFTSGGTESNIVAVHAAREAWRRRTGHGARRPHIVVPATAHFSFEKARRLTDVGIRYAETDEHHRVRPDAVADLVDDDTALVVGVAGTTEVGVLDDIGALSQVAVARQVPLHVDAALGGFVLPFLEAAGRSAVAWDFAVPGVTSITMDPHKMGTSLIPGGILLVREPATLDAVAVDTPYVTSDRQSGILGTRPGAGAAAAWAVATHHGRAGYAAIVRRCLDLSDDFRAALTARGIRYVPGDLNVILVPCHDPYAVQDALDARGWRVNAVPQLSGIRIVVMPHVQRTHLDRFLPDLIAVLADDGVATAARDDTVREEACP